MIINLNDQQMLELWREGAGLEPALSEASVERFDSIAVNARLRTAMRAWYLDCLASEPLGRLPVTDITPSVNLVPGPAPDQWTLHADAPCMRITTIAVEGYGLIRIVDPGTEPKHVIPLMNRFVRNGSQPVAFHTPGTPSAILNLRSVKPPVLLRVEAVVDSGDSLYCVDERWLDRIPELARKTLFNT